MLIPIFKLGLARLLLSFALCLFLLSATLPGVTVKSYATEHKPLPWQEKHKILQQQRDTIFAHLEVVRAALRQRIPKEDREMLARLHPPAPRATGYGLLPIIKSNPPVVTVKRKQTFYSLKWLEGRFDEEWRRINKWSGEISEASDIEVKVADFEQSLKALRTLEIHLDYHSQWQKSIARYPAFFRKKNQLVALIREMNLLILNKQNPEQIAALRRQVMQSLAPFKASQALKLNSKLEGKKILPITVCTDIEGSAFLLAFKEGVYEAFSSSKAARDHGFSIALTWLLKDGNYLYDGKPPAQGEAINLTAHRALFKDCPFVLTTGAASTHALVGNYIVLGTDPTNRRTLAHEFGHLLGFSDAYVRSYDGQPGDTYGVTFVEWTGLTNDLMGNSGGGQVSDEMIMTLITAYDGSTVK